MNKLTVGQLMAILGRLDPDLGIDTIANNHIARSGAWPKSRLTASGAY